MQVLTLTPVEVLFTLLFCLLFGMAGGYGGRLLALAKVRGELAALAGYCEQLDRRIKSQEGSRGQAVRRSKADEVDSEVAAIVAAAAAPRPAAPRAPARLAAPPGKPLHPAVQAQLHDEGAA